jgi:hypothetical protein
MWKLTVLGGCVVNLLTAVTPILNEQMRELTIAGYWTLHAQLSPTEWRSEVVDVDGVEGRGSSERAWTLSEATEMSAAQALRRELLEPTDATPANSARPRCWWC